MYIHWSSCADLRRGFQQNQIITSVVKGKKKAEEDEKGVALAPSKKDLNPWYSEKKSGRSELPEEKVYAYHLDVNLSLF